MICCLLQAQNKDTLCLTDAKFDTLNVVLSDYEYVLLLDMYVCEKCIRKRIRENSKILLIPIDLFYYNGQSSRVVQRIGLKKTFKQSDCYFFLNEGNREELLRRFPKNQLIPLRKGGKLIKC